MYSIYFVFCKKYAKLSIMNVSFCGHSYILDKEDIENKLQNALNMMDYPIINFYMGGYGDFDAIALKCFRGFKENKKNTSIYFISPYLDEKYLKGKSLLIDLCDGVIYPDIEKVPYKFSILARNKWLVEHSDIIICCVYKTFGGAAKMLEYAKTKNKIIINLAKK